MSFLGDLFTGVPAPSQDKQEVQRLTDELIQIGKRDDFLSETARRAVQLSEPPYPGARHRQTPEPDRRH